MNTAAVLRGTTAALIFSLLGGATLGTAVHLTSISEPVAIWLGKAVLVLSVFIGAALAAYLNGSAGLTHGLAVGLVFFLFLLLINKFFFPGNLLLLPVIEKLALTAGAGIIGGMTGVYLAST